MDGDREIRLLQLSVTLPLDSTMDDAKSAAEDVIVYKLKILNFEIVDVRVSDEGTIKTKDGVRHGRRYSIAFRELYGSVIFVHEDYESIMKAAAGLSWTQFEL